MTAWILTLLAKSPYLAVFSLMLLENIFPPIPSEVILPLAGFIANEQQLNIPLILTTASLGSLCGTVIWYFIGRIVSDERLIDFFRKYGVYIAITDKDFHKGMAVFEKYCGLSVFIGRLIPVIRTVISIPAGLLKMDFFRFLILSFAGTLVWSGILLTLGYQLGNKHEIATRYMAWFTNIILGLIVILYLIKIIRFHRRK